MAPRDTVPFRRNSMHHAVFRFRRIVVRVGEGIFAEEPIAQRPKRLAIASDQVRPFAYPGNIPDQIISDDQ